MKKEQTKNQQEKNQKKSQKLQWHPAFCSALRLELLEDAENLEFTDEFQLTEKPLQIDCTVVKVKKDCKMKSGRSSGNTTFLNINPRRMS